MEPFFRIIEFTAVTAGALYGILLARSKGMDFVGGFSLAFIVAFGGGTLRDLFLDRHPLFWIEHEIYPLTVFALALLLASFSLRLRTSSCTCATLASTVSSVLPVPCANKIFPNMIQTKSWLIGFVLYDSVIHNKTNKI